MFRTSLGEYFVAEALGRLLVEDAVLLEDAESISIKHFSPFITIVASRIAARHDVRELHRHTSIGQLLAQDGFLPRLLLKGDDVVCEFVFLGVVRHIE